MKTNKKIIYQVLYYSRERTGGFGCYQDEQEWSNGKIYATKDALYRNYPNIPSESDVIIKYDVGCLNDLPDGLYTYYTELTLYY